MSEAQTIKKSPRKVRGTATFHDDDSVEFQPWGNGEPVQKSVKKKGDSRFYETEGEKQSSYIAHLKVAKDSSDPVAEMYEQLQYFTKSLQKNEPKEPKGKRLLDKKAVQVWHKKADNKVIVRMEIPTDTGAELSSILFNLTSDVNKCFAINRNSLRPQKK